MTRAEAARRRGNPLVGRAAPIDRGRDLPSLTSLRAAAALLVFCYHAGPDTLPFNAEAVGYAGVTFFFVLSGFVLVWGTGTHLDVRRFYVRRAARIYPAHLVVWLLTLVLPIAAGVRDLGPALSNAILLQAWVPHRSWIYSVNGVTWSLSCEIAFYALFPVALLLLRRWRLQTGWLVVALLFVATNVFVIAVSASGEELDPWWSVANAFPLVRLPEFLLGMLASITVQAGWRLRWAGAAALTAIAVIGAAATHQKPALDTWAAPLALALVVLATQSDLLRRRWFDARGLVYAGKVSFAFYLVHQLVLLNLIPILGPGLPAVLLCLAASILIAALLHHGVEMPLHRSVASRLRAGQR